MKKLIWLVLICSSSAFAQTKANTCILNSAKAGETITVRGKAVQEAHDLAFAIQGCDGRVLLTYAGNPDNDVPVSRLQSDEGLERFQKYTSAVYKSASCIQCPEYGNIEATLTGTLEVATIPPGTTKDSMGFLHDTSGKIVGTWGWGHPIRIFRYRLVVFSASNVKARKVSQSVK